MPSKRELAANPPPKPKPDKRPKLWVLMQVHRYGQSLTAEVLATTADQARSLFEDDLHYSKVRGGRFFVTMLWCPSFQRIPNPSPLTKSNVIRRVRPIVYGKSFSPFPLIPGKPTGPVEPRPQGRKINIPADRTLALYGRRKPHRSTRYRRPFPKV